MSDETTKVTAEEPQAQAEAPAVNPVDEWLKTAPTEEIMKHDRFRGIMGNAMQREREKIRKELNDDTDRAAREKAEADLIELARWQPQQFAEKYLTDYEQKKIERDLTNLKNDALREVVETLGEGYRDLPEFNDLTPTELEKLNAAVIGKDQRAQIKSFNVAALDVIAERRANAKLAKYKESELPKEREAARQEEAAKRLNGSARPSLTRGTPAPQGNGWQDLPVGPEYNKAYEKYVLHKNR
jgi:hypothetical protein